MSVCLSFQTGSLHAAADCADERKDSIAETVVYGRHLLRQTGIFGSRIDSAALKRNISSSLAELLSYNSSVFIRQHGRASLSTISLRGTSASHTQILWNGLKLNSPMLGMADFSLIPAYFMDSATILHGTSSLQEVSGGLGGAVLLETGLPAGKGLAVKYIQGLGSWLTADEFLEAGYLGKRFGASVKILLSTSENDFRFTNMDKKTVSYDENMQITDSRHPVERNRNGEYRDFHVMPVLGWDFMKAGRLKLSVWYLDSWRELPPQTVDYGQPKDFINEQKEQSLRTTLQWVKDRKNGKTSLSAGYARTRLGYIYAFGNGNGPINLMTESTSKAGTMSFSAGHEQYFGTRCFLSADLSVCRHRISSTDRSAVPASGRLPGYDAVRTEISASVSLKWQALRILALSFTVREEMYGKDFSPLIPALNADLSVWDEWGLYIKASASMNYRYPTLNDLYFLPGGNPDLRPESGFSYDIGYSLSRSFPCGLSADASGGWFDSRINDWILWMPEGAKKNFWTPVNVMQVHAFGAEQSIRIRWQLNGSWELDLDSHYTWSPSRSSGSKDNPADRSSGKQLPYIPEHAASFTAGLSWKKWSAAWEWCWYSRRYTASDNSASVPPYIMNSLELGRDMRFRLAELSVGISIRNIFNEQYISVLSRPMPGINYELYLCITPDFKKISMKKR